MKLPAPLALLEFIYLSSMEHRKTLYTSSLLSGKLNPTRAGIKSTAQAVEDTVSLII